VRNVRKAALCFIWLLPAAYPAWAELFAGPPEGYALVAEDDCGNPDFMPHVIRGKEYVFPLGVVSGSLEDRDIIFDDEYCVLRYEGLNPAAEYKVEVVYVTEATGRREQSLEANGLVVHDTMSLPAVQPGRFLFVIPRQAYAAGGPLELRFIRKSGANAVVSYVRIWSTDPRPLSGKPPLWEARGFVEKDWLRQDRLRGGPRFFGWDDPAREVRESVVPAIDEQIGRGRRILADFELLGARGLDDSAHELSQVARARDRLLSEGNLSPEEWLKVYLAARWAVRRLVFKHPALECDSILFVRRHHPNVMHQCARRLGSFTPPGGGISILTNLRPDAPPKVTCITEGRFPSGTFSRPDLSFDGKRVVFGFAPERQAEGPRLTYGDISERTAELYATHAVGPCHEFQIWEMGVNGDPPPRQLTHGPAENTDPIYLPDGRIAFMSHRHGGLVQCGDWALAYCIYTMRPDGSDVRKLTRSKDGEWDPFLLDDGTIGFTRWEYVMKFWSPIQMLWSVRPDGTNPSMIYGSDLSRRYPYPLNYASARQIPGTSKLVCIGSAHHNTGAGPVCIVDLAIGPNEAAGLQRLTPVRYVETDDQQPNNGWYDCPYPLSDNYFLVSYSFSVDETDTTSYAIYLLDAYGGKELIYRDEELSALFPMPLRPRRVPGPLPQLATLGEGWGEFLVQDVHEGLLPEMRGLARYIQVVECHERYIHTSPYDVQVGPDSGFETKTVLGVVPVESDGSAYFRLPSGKSVFFSVLDENFQALHTMRSVTDVQAGERTSCIGCHEPRRRAPAVRFPAAAARPPSDIEPPPWGVQPMDFAVLVQPVLDRHCVRCHDGSGADGKAFDLSARETRPFMGVPLPVSYYNLRRYVRHAPIFEYFLSPGSFGSRVSPLMRLLAQGHGGVRLDPAEWRVLCAWIDCNAPGFGEYEVAAKGRGVAREREALRARRKTGDAQRRQMLADALPAGERLVCYLDCGPAESDGVEGGVCIREVAGWPYCWGAGEALVPPWYDDISFDARAVEYVITGLRRDKHYRLGFSWWDYDGGGREQGVVVTAASGQREYLLPRTRLPAWSGAQQKPEDRWVDLPDWLASGGEIRIAFTNEAGRANAVVSEVWLTERD